MSLTKNINRSKCPNCEYECDCASSDKQGIVPKPNDFSICMKCGQINQFDENMKIIKPDDEFLEMVSLCEPSFFVFISELSEKVKKNNIFKYYK
jgi:hypothetical protein